ncbi:unnamed protein product, partial [Symbiodinium sp. CCMP2592]
MAGGKTRRSYSVCSCGAWIWTDRIGAQRPCCQQCGKAWPKSLWTKPARKAPEEDTEVQRTWRPGGLATRQKQKGQRGINQDGTVHRALQSLWEKLAPDVQKELASAGVKPPEPPKEDDLLALLRSHEAALPQEVKDKLHEAREYKTSTLRLRDLGHKKVQLQSCIDDTKMKLRKQLESMKELLSQISEAQAEVAKVSEQFKQAVLTDPSEEASAEDTTLLQLIADAGITLTQEQIDKLKSVEEGHAIKKRKHDAKSPEGITSAPPGLGQRQCRVSRLLQAVFTRMRVLVQCATFAAREPTFEASFVAGLRQREAVAVRARAILLDVDVLSGVNWHTAAHPPRTFENLINSIGELDQAGDQRHAMSHPVVAVRPAGCTQADQVLVHSTWLGSALAQSGDPGVSALWASLLQGLEHMCHVQVLQAVEALEAGQYILEDTFPWFAAELAVEAGDDVPWHVAASAIRDVIANLNSNAEGKKLLLVSSNVTTWRKSLATFLAGISPDLWLVQETHIKEEQGDLLATHVGAFGYQAFSLPGVGFQSVVLHIRGVDIFLVNVSLQGEFLVAGDFNEDISVLVTTSLAQVALALRLIWSLPVSEQQFRHHSKLWMQKQSASYGKWLKQASCKGLRGLFTSVKAEEAVQLRPFLHQPVQDRIYLRWRQWFELWSAPGGVEPALLSDLRQRARMQAKELGPIPLDQAVAAFKRVPSKAPGIDGWTFEVLKNLQRPAVASIISFLHHCETEATWPAQMLFALIALLPKSEKRERPIALLHVLYRTWVRMRWKLVSDWQFQYCKAAVWDKAMPGSQVLDVALGRLLRGEAARQSGQHLVTIFIDMALLTYMGPRFLQSEGSLCPAIIPTKGVLAGCPAAPSISKLVVHPIAVAATSKRATSNLDVWIDDLSLDCVGASAKQIASDAVLLFRSLRTSIEAN